MGRIANRPVIPTRKPLYRDEDGLPVYQLTDAEAEAEMADLLGTAYQDDDTATITNAKSLFAMPDQSVSSLRIATRRQPLPQEAMTQVPRVLKPGGKYEYVPAERDYSRRGGRTLRKKRGQAKED